MALTAVLTERTYRSESGGQVYHFKVTLDQNGTCDVREIRTPTGFLRDSVTGIPGPVLDDINTAKQQLEDLVAQTSAVNGILTYTDENTQSFTFSTPFANTEYGVVPTLPEFLGYRVTNKTTTGFDLELSTDYTGDVRVDVFV